METILILLIAALIAWCLRYTFLKSREESFKKGLRLRGYSESEIEDAVQNFLNKPAA